MATPVPLNPFVSPASNAAAGAAGATGSAAATFASNVVGGAAQVADTLSANTSAAAPYTGGNTPGATWAAIPPAAAPVTPPAAPAPAPAPTPAAPAPAPAPAPAAPAPAASAAPTTPPAYNGASITDYLTSKGMPSDIASRTVLASQHGIDNYTGTAEQNTQLLNTMRTADGGTSGSGITTPTGTPGSSGTMGTTDTTKTGTPDPYAGMDPVQKQVAMYQEAYKSLGLSTIKDQYDNFTKQYGELTQELADKIDEHNNNPWLSSTSRSEEIKKVQDRYDVKLKTLSNLMTLTDSMYKQGQAQVDHLVSDANADIKATNDLAQKQIDAANALAKDNVVVSAGGRETLRNKVTGAIVADLGPSNKTAAGAGTLQERQQSTIDKVGSLFAPGTTIPGSGGVPFLDSNGNATPEGWSTAMRASDLPRATFIKQFGNLIVDNGGGVSSKYGLTPTEIKTITGALPTP